MRDSSDNAKGPAARAAADRWESGGSAVAQADRVEAAPKPLEPSTSQPSTSQPSTSQPSTSQPSTSQPATSQPDAARPAAPPPGGARAPGPKNRVRWAWNWPLLALSLIGAISGATLLVGLYYWQSSRVGDQLRQLVVAAQEDQDTEQEVVWLHRYLALRPDDAEAQIELAWAYDAVADNPAEINQARRYFNRAITAAENSEDLAARDALRGRLIERLLELGGGWFVEAERQILLLNAPAGDPEVLAQLARCQLAQAEAEGPPTAAAPESVPDRETHYWQWAAAQPVGELVRLAAEANPDSTGLAAALVSIYLEHPEFFEPPGAPASQRDFTAEATRVLEQLSERHDDAYAQWIVYRYGSRLGPQFSLPPLVEFATAALQRLETHAEAWAAAADSEAAAAEPSPAALPSEPAPVAQAPVALPAEQTSATELAAGDRAPLSGAASDPRAAGGEEDQEEPYAPRWDVELVLQQAAALTGAADREAAQKLYEALVALPEGMLHASQVELAYGGLGETLWHLGEHQQAQQTWQTGNERTGGESLVLLEPLTASLVRSAPVDQAVEAVERMAEATDKASLWLTRVGRHHRHRSMLQSQVHAANWRVEVFRAEIAARQGQHREAITRLERALGAQLPVPTTLRIEAAHLLASVYGKESLWDLAGRVLDEAVLLAPQDRSLRLRAADAWQRAEVPDRAAGHLQHADDGSFMAALAYAQSATTSVARQTSGQRDFGPAQAAIAEAERRFEQAVKEGQTPTDAWQLGLLKLTVPSAAANRGADPPRAGSSETEQAEERAAERLAATKMQLVDLCLQYPQVPQLQTTAAFTLQRMGDSEGADEAVERLAAIPEIDPLTVTETRASLMAMRGQTPAAAAELLELAAERPEVHARLAKLAAVLWESAGERDEAIDVLLEIAPEDREVAVWMQLGAWLLESEATKARGAAPERTAEHYPSLQQIERQLRAAEGEEGTAWRWLAASRLLQQAAGNPQGAALLSDAGQLQAEILARRPRWARGLTLGGRIAVAQGKPQQAVDFLRRAIAEGDQNVDTVLLLVRQLNRLGDSAAAEQELARLEHLPDATGEIAAASVGLAIGNANFKRAVERARSVVESRPEDVDALLILAQTAYLAAKADPPQAEKLDAEAADALQRASELTEGRSLGVWDARFRFQLRTGGADAARQVLEAMEASSLPESSRWLAVGQGYLALADWQAARARLDKALQASPSNVAVHLALADLHRGVNDSEGVLEALEAAHRLAPEREDVRNRLAFALAANHSSEIPWDRISELIGASRADAEPKNQLQHALLQAARGDGPQIERARVQLQQLMRSSDASVADDAARILATVERRKWNDASAEGQAESAAQALAECRRLYEGLTERSEPAPIDLYRHGDLLLRAKLIPEAEQTIDRLGSLAPASRLVLDLRLRLEKERSNEAQLGPLVKEWLKQPTNQSNPVAKAVAGRALASLGSYADALELLEAAYQEKPSELANYVYALSQAGESQRAAEVCIAHFRKLRSPEPIALLADLLVKEGGSGALNGEAEPVLAEGVSEFPTSVRVLEAIGTLRLVQQQYTEAIAFLTQAEKINPSSLVTLNNLAMALSEVAGREDEGLMRIERAVEIFGRNPELLDTLGIVQMRCEQLSEAETTLREAYEESQDPRHLFHLLLVLKARQNAAELQRLWNQLDLDPLQSSALTPDEREQLQRLQQQLGQPNPV